MNSFDVVILGAGGAGLMCALTAAKRGRKVAILDHSAKVGGKILISGGGRCNFTNTGATYKNYVSQNEHFCKSALSRYQPEEFISLVRSHKIAFHEKKLGQLFCDGSAVQIVEMLLKECREAGVQFFLGKKVTGVEKREGAEKKYCVYSEFGEFESESLVVATGGLSIPKIGATSFGYDLATQFGLDLIERAPALDGFTFSESDQKKWDGLSGIALDVEMSSGEKSFRENLLITHVGLSGPASLQVSLHWYPGDTVKINFLPSHSREQLVKWFYDRKTKRIEMKHLLSEFLVRRFSERFCELFAPTSHIFNFSKTEVEAFCEKLQAYTFVPKSTVGYQKAEVTRGGVNTDELSSKTLEAKKSHGLFFIGEVVDVTGWLGGYNFQWAWASGHAAGEVV